MDAPETTDEPRGGARANLANRVARIALILFVLCVLYVLSIGPAVGLLAWAEVPWYSTVRVCTHAFYRPVLYVRDHTTLYQPFTRYTQWWVKLGERLR